GGEPASYELPGLSHARAPAGARDFFRGGSISAPVSTLSKYEKRQEAIRALRRLLGASPSNGVGARVSKFIASLRITDILSAPCFREMRAWSSPKVTSSTQCSLFSTCQCPRTFAASTSAGSSQLEMYARRSHDVTPRRVRSASTKINDRSFGHASERDSHATSRCTHTRRTSFRPCPLSAVSTWLLASLAKRASVASSNASSTSLWRLG